MKNSLFVAGLDFSITSEELKDIFAEHGTVTNAKVLTDRETGRSRGFGFVDMSTDAEAATCIAKLNETSVKGRNIVVREKEERARNEGGYRR